MFRFSWVRYGCAAIALVAIASPVTAQIVPDTTLPENSIVISNENIFIIDGGTTAGGSLFHSFAEFSVPQQTTAFFNSAATIETIFARVTGGNISNIDGTIAATGNLFLLNSNGLIFGPEARLQVGGSFVGSTAQSVVFADGTEFSTVLSQNQSPLLSVNVPVGLQMGENSGTIVNRSIATSAVPLPDLDPNFSIGLGVQPGQTLALIGGDIALESGNLTAFSGEVRLGSAASSGIVTFSPTPAGIAFNFDSIETLGNIDLSGTSTVNVSGPGGGAIVLLGREIVLRDEASLVAVTLGDADGQGIEITGDRFRLLDGALLSTATFGEGNAGNLTIRTSEFVEFSGLGVSVLEQLFLTVIFSNIDIITVDFGVLTVTQGSGRAGTIAIETGNLTMRDGAFLSTSTNGVGVGGNAIVRAGNIEIEGASIVASTGLGSTGASGDIIFEARSLRLVDGGFITATTLGPATGGDIIARADTVEAIGVPVNTVTGFSTASLFNTGRAGNIEIDARQIILADGAFVGSSSGGLAGVPIARGGPAGNITLTASESIEVRGTSADDLFPARIGSLSASDSPAGNIRIETGELILREGGLVNVAGGLAFSGTADAGVLEIVADSVRLEDGGMLLASTVSGLGGNISVEAGTLQLRGQSSIATDAGNSNGGNITLNAETLVALENSDITANAEVGFGGRVSITTDAIFGTEFREFQTSQSDITATSELGAEFSGIVEINTPDVDSTSGLFRLRTETIDATALGFEHCRNYAGSSFYNTGRGGIPENPRQFLEIQMTVDDLGELEPLQSDGPDDRAQMAFAPTETLTEATTWTIAPDGQISLVSQVSTNVTLPHLDCPSLSQ